MNVCMDVEWSESAIVEVSVADLLKVFAAVPRAGPEYHHSV